MTTPHACQCAEEVKRLKKEVAEQKQTLAWTQRLPDLEWAQVSASLMMRLANLSRAGGTEEAKRLMDVLDRGKTYVARALAERDAALAEASASAIALATAAIALEHCRQRPHEHNPAADWQGPTQCDVIDRALESIRARANTRGEK